MLRGPFRDFHKILTARQHPTKPQHNNVYQRVFEILTLTAGIRDRLQPLDQRTRLRGHTPAYTLRIIRAPALSYPLLFTRVQVRFPWSRSTCGARSVGLYKNRRWRCVMRAVSRPKTLCQRILSILIESGKLTRLRTIPITSGSIFRRCNETKRYCSSATTPKKTDGLVLLRIPRSR